MSFVENNSACGDFCVESLKANTQMYGCGVASAIVLGGGEAGEAVEGVFVRGGSNHGWTRINTDAIGPSFAEAMEGRDKLGEFVGSREPEFQGTIECAVG